MNELTVNDIIRKLKERKEYLEHDAESHYGHDIIINELNLILNYIEKDAEY